VVGSNGMLSAHPAAAIATDHAKATARRRLRDAVT
jgi:hypothetical protein